MRCEVLRAAGRSEVGVVGHGAVAGQGLEDFSCDGVLECSEDRGDGPALGELFVWREAKENRL